MASPPRNHRDLWGFETHERVPDCLVEIRSRAEREWAAFTEANGEDAAACGSAEAKELVRRCGICPSKRRGLWMVWSGAQALKEDRQARYSALIHKASQSSCKEEYAAQFDQVEVDLERTFPDHPHFRKGEESPGLDALRRILTAFILDSPEVGYTQSMNYIAAFMMLVVELDGRTAMSAAEAAVAEEDAFWLTYALCRRAISGYHSPDVSNPRPSSPISALASHADAQLCVCLCLIAARRAPHRSPRVQHARCGEDARTLFPPHKPRLP